MPSFRASLRSFILSDTAVAASVDDRIYSGTAPQGCAKPYIVLNTISSVTSGDIDSDLAVDSDRVQADLYADTFISCSNLNKALRKHLNCKHHYKAGNYKIYSSNQVNKIETTEKDPDGSQNILHRFIVDYMIIHDVDESP